jgi:hypothetical protein
MYSKNRKTEISVALYRIAQVRDLGHRLRLYLLQDFVLGLVEQIVVYGPVVGSIYKA